MGRRGGHLDAPEAGPPEQSNALQLFDLSTRSLHAAAHEAGTDRPTFQNRLQRARLRLTRLLRAPPASFTV